MTRFRNIQAHGIYCSLNLGVSGYVSDEDSLAIMKSSYQIGDIIDLIVAETFDSKVCELNEKQLVYLEMPGLNRQKR